MDCQFGRQDDWFPLHLIGTSSIKYCFFFYSKQLLSKKLKKSRTCRFLSAIPSRSSARRQIGDQLTVSVQGIMPCERLSTKLTSKRLDPEMQFGMAIPVVLPGKGFRAQVACKGPFQGMCASM
jgi:hypothetical protein